MNFTYLHSIEILERTPGVLGDLLKGLSEDWTHANEGENTWSVFDIIGHLIEGEKTDWVPRMKIILSDDKDKSFVPFDRYAQMEQNKGKSLHQLLEIFKDERQGNIQYLKTLSLSKDDLNKTGIHPHFGTVTLSQLISTWTVHDLNHIAQIARVMSVQYKEAVGPWIEYLGILKK